MTPHALGPFTANDTYDQQLMEIEDSTRNVDWNELTGGTLLTVLVDYVHDPILGNAGSASNPDWQVILHHGIFMDEAAAPEQSRWDPNTPHGDFMWRQTWSFHHQHRQMFTGGPTFMTLHEGCVIRVRTRVRRRISEDMRLWAAAHYFERLGDNVDMSLAVGYTGRVLIQLP